MAKETISNDGGEPSGLSQVMTMSDDALDTEDEEKRTPLSTWTQA